MKRRLLLFSFLVIIMLFATHSLKADDPQLIISAGKGGFMLTSPDGDFQFKVRGYVQADGRFFFNRSSTTIDTFVLRRVRPVFEGTVFKYFDFKIMPDFGGGTTVLQDAYLDARFHPAFKVRFGKGKTPFGLERLQSATDLMLIERSLATNLVPNRDIGIYAYGDIVPKRVNYAIGVMNGVIDLGSADIDNGQDKDFVARIFAYPIPEFGVGIAVTAGDQFGSLLSPSLPSYRTQGQLVWFRYRAGVTSDLTTVANGQRTRYSPQGTFYKGPVGVLAEYVSSSQEVSRLTDSADIRNTAYNITAAFAITGEDESYKGIVPENNFDPSSGKWGGIEVAVRYSRLNIDEDVFPVFADPLTSASSAENFGAGLNWYLNKNVKFMFSYDHTDFETADIKTEQLFMTRFQIAW